MKTIACSFLLIALSAAAIPLKDADTQHDVEPFIIHGAVARHGQFPYQAAVYMDGASFCGGSVIAPRWIMTAAHCVDGVSVFTVRLGAQNMMNPREAGRQVFTSRQGIHHEGWDPNTVQHDMGLVKLMRPAVFNSYVSPVRLPSADQLGELFVNTPATVSGWGKTSASGTTISAVLRFINTTIISNEECIKAYDSEPIMPTTLCARAESIKSTCNGDSGGPLVIADKEGIPTQVGVVSFVSNSGCDQSFPFGFSRLTSYMTWVSSQTGIPIKKSGRV